MKKGPNRHDRRFRRSESDEDRGAILNELRILSGANAKRPFMSDKLNLFTPKYPIAKFPID
jgi:hypothetical protein